MERLLQSGGHLKVGEHSEVVAGPDPIYRLIEDAMAVNDLQ
jgi:hypothetical protein